MEEKKSEILLKAAEVFMRYGIRSVTMDDLARELSVSKKTIYMYFPDKDALVQEIILMKTLLDKSCCETFSIQAENAIDEIFHISQFVSEMIKNIHPSVFFDLQKYHPKAWKIIQDHKWTFVYGQILQNIERGIKEKLYRDNMNPQLIARMYVAKTDMVFGGELFPSDQFDLEEVFMELFRFQVRGMANEKGLDYLKQRLNNVKK
jgi:TetR/AcrR family transcriptional regulator, cholesterol catabolism regulator